MFRFTMIMTAACLGGAAGGFAAEKPSESPRSSLGSSSPSAAAAPAPPSHGSDVAAASTDANDGLPTPPAGKAWKLIWNDEFDGQTLDDSKWTYRPDGKRKEGWWSHKAVKLDGKGHLSIEASRDGDKCVSGDIISAKKFEHAFGYYVARVQFQKQPGHWPAFWLTNSAVLKSGESGCDGTEIDIFERPHLGDQIEHNLHWDGYEATHRCAGHHETVPGLSDGWHTTALWWTPDSYAFYVDGKERWRTDAGGVSHAQEYILLSDEVSKWAGDISKAKLPDTFLVDYVRVYDLVAAAQ